MCVSSYDMYDYGHLDFVDNDSDDDGMIGNDW